MKQIKLRNKIKNQKDYDKTIIPMKNKIISDDPLTRIYMRPLSSAKNPKNKAPKAPNKVLICRHVCIRGYFSQYKLKYGITLTALPA